MNRNFNDDEFNEETDNSVEDFIKEADENDIPIVLKLEGLEGEVFEHTNLNSRFRVFHDFGCSNTIVFTPHNSKMNFIDIIENTNEEAYGYLMDMLGVNFNLVVDWELKNDSDESNYTIYYNVNLTEDEIGSYLKTKNKLENILGDSIGELEGKHNEVEMNEVLCIDDLIDELDEFYDE